MLLHYENAKKVSNRKISYFRQKMILYYYTKKKELRQKWLLGKIIDLTSSQDRQIRGARVLLGKSRNTVDRPVNRMCPLGTYSKFVLKDSKQNKVQ